MTRPFLIDTDPGIDDALAVLLALHSPEARVEAVTTVAGNVPLDHATRNLLRLLRAAAPARLPRVARGAAAPLARPLAPARHVHGEDGLGNVDRLRDPAGQPRFPPHPATALETRDGPDLILEMADRFGERLEVVALGPLTNLALALQRGRERLLRIRRLVVMGGAVAVPGNVTPAAEFNVYVDPEAAALVLGAGLPVELIPLDVTRQVVLGREALARTLEARPGPVADLVAAFTPHGFDVAEGRGDAGIVLHDPLAVAVALCPGLVGFDDLRVEVECEGRLTRGLTLADRRPLPPGERRPPNCRVATAVDADGVRALLLERLCGLPGAGP